MAPRLAQAADSQIVIIINPQNVLRVDLRIALIVNQFHYNARTIPRVDLRNVLVYEAVAVQRLLFDEHDVILILSCRIKIYVVITCG